MTEPLADDRQDRASARRGLFVVVSAYAIVFAAELPYQAVLPLLPTLAHSLVLSKIETSALVAAPPAGVLAASLPIARVAERCGTRPVVLAAGLGVVVTSLAQAAARGFWELLAARIVLGFAHAGVWIAAPVLIAGAASDARRVSAIAANMSVGALGAIVGPAMGGFVGERYGVRAPFAVAAVVGLAALAAFVFAVRGGTGGRGESLPGSAPRATSAFRLLAVPRVRAAVALTLLAALVGNVISFLVALRLGSNGVSPSTIGVVFASASAVLLLGSVGVVILGSKVVGVGVGIATAAILAGSMIVVIVSHATGPVIAFTIAKSLFVAIVYTIAYPIAAGSGGLGAAGALGLVSVAWGVGAICGPLAAGALLGPFGERATYGVFLVVALAIVGATIVDWLGGPRFGVALGEES